MKKSDKKKKCKFREVRAVVSICGDYCAWHESDISSEYIFGDEFSIHSDFIDSMEEDEDFDFKYSKFNKKKNNTKKDLDNIVEDYIDNYSGDYCDYEIKTILLKMKGDGIVQEYLQI